MMKITKQSIKTNVITSALTAGGVVVLASAILPLGSAFADSSNNTLTATQQTHLQNMISKGDQEITRRLTTLGQLTNKINTATKLTASDKATLTSEVSSTITGLTSLKAQLDSETTIAAAHTDVENIYSEYRVYALVAPKIGLIKVADDQQVVEAKLATLAQKLQTRITADQQANKNVTTLQADLTDMNTQISAAQAISPSVESAVIGLEPTNYNSNHAVLSGYNTQLKTAHTDNQAATTDAKNIIAGLKSLE